MSLPRRVSRIEASVRPILTADEFCALLSRGPMADRQIDALARRLPDAELSRAISVLTDRLEDGA